MATPSETDRKTKNSTGGSTAEAGESGRLSGVKQSASEAYETARERTRAALTTTRESVRGAGQRTANGIDSNPVAAVIGGLAIGAVVGALLPRSQKEQALLGSTGRRITDSARQALSAARDAGRKELDEIGISRDGVKRRLEEFTDRAAGAVRESRSGGGGGGGGDNS
jgi:ElaB/YqjD/DUF883 family membrane-anchored ribosome-binding protein